MYLRAYDWSMYMYSPGETSRPFFGGHQSQQIQRIPTCDPSISGREMHELFQPLKRWIIFV